MIVAVTVTGGGLSAVVTVPSTLKRVVVSGMGVRGPQGPEGPTLSDGDGVAVIGETINININSLTLAP